MKILTVHNRYQQPGGEDVVFAREAALLREYGHEVVEYVDDNKHIAGQHRLTVALESVWSRPTYQRLLQILLKLRPDIVHFHNTFVRISASAYAACRVAGVPVVQTLHNYRSVCPAATLFRQGQVCEDCVGTRLSWPSVRNGCYHGSRLQTAVVAGLLGVQRWYRTLSEPVDVYAALTYFAKRKLIAGGLPADRIVVKPNFVADPGVRTQSVRTQIGKSVLFVGRLVPEKGVLTLLRAWCKLKHIPLSIVGNGPLLTEAKTFIEQHQLSNVSLLGQCDAHEVIRLIKDASCVLVPSEWYEGFPLIIAEAFACGVPVITSRLGAMAEIVADGTTGLHHTPGDADDLAAKVQWAWAHSERLDLMGAHARQVYEREYSAERNYTRLMEIYDMARVTRAAGVARVTDEIPGLRSSGAEIQLPQEI